LHNRDEVSIDETKCFFLGLNADKAREFSTSRSNIFCDMSCKRGNHVVSSNVIFFGFALCNFNNGKINSTRWYARDKIFLQYFNLRKLLFCQRNRLISMCCYRTPCLENVINVTLCDVLSFTPSFCILPVIIIGLIVLLQNWTVILT